MNTNILNLTTDIVQSAKDEEFIRNMSVASLRFSRNECFVGFLRPLLAHANYETLLLLFYPLVSLIALFAVHYIIISQ